MFDLSVVIVTLCRESLRRAVQSVFSQRFVGSIQILIGIDRDPDSRAVEFRAQFARECPSHISIVWLDVGYSTSKRHGGIHDCYFGGSLRSAMTFLAASEIVVYLDDDDWLASSHCADIQAAISDKHWAFAYSIYADNELGAGLCVDEIESVGVDSGIFKERFGGFVRPSGLAINKIKLLPIVYLWSCSAFRDGDGEDRLIFSRLRHQPHGCTGNATVYYSLDPKDGMHERRLEFMASKGIAYAFPEKTGSVR